MIRNAFVILISILAVAGCVPSPETDSAPNFIIIFDDQHNSKHMGWSGMGDGVRTPNIDRLSAESVTFTNAYASCPVCAPARHSVYTGHFPSRHGVVMNDMELTEGMPTLMELLAGGGYTTANVGKMHFAPYNARKGFQYVLNHEFFADGAGISHFRPWLEKKMQERGLQAERYPQWNHAELAGHWIFSTDYLGFTHDIPLELTSEHWVTDNSISFIKDHLKNRQGVPFFLHASYFAPHHPYGAAGEFDTYDPEKIPLPPSWSPEASEAFSKKEFQQIKAKYFGFITQLDHEIGRLLDFVDSDPALAGNTVILFMSDHGDRMGEHGMLFKGDEGAMLDGSAAVPGTYSCLLPPGIQSKCYFSTSIIPINKQLNRTQCELNTTP